MISRGIPSPQDPQWGCFEQDQAEALSKIGNKVIVLSVDSRFLWTWRKIGVTHIIKNDVVYYNCFLIPGALTSLLGYRVNRWVKRKQIDILYKKINLSFGKPDIIYGHYFFNTELGAYLKEKNNIPLVGIEHAGRFNFAKLDRRTYTSAKYAYSMTDQIITVSCKLQDSIKRHFNKDCQVVYNLVNELYFKETIFNKDRYDYPLNIVSVGSLVDGKGFDLLIRAIKSVDNVRLTIIGGGPEYDNLKKLITELNLTNQVQLLGKRSKPEIISCFKKSDFFVLASHNETFGLVYAEAMALGLPVIGTRCGGPEEIINESNGLLVEVNNITQLIDSIIWMRDHISHYDRIQISEKCRFKYAPNIIAKQLTDIFEGVVEKYKSSK